MAFGSVVAAVAFGSVCGVRECCGIRECLWRSGVFVAFGSVCATAGATAGATVPCCRCG